MFTLLAASAFAQQFTWTYQAGAVLSPDPGSSWANNSIANPSVVYDTVNGQYIMAFESRTSTVDANCPNGVWDVGMATSPDGISWTMLPSPVVAPNPAANNYYSCVAAHPALVFRTTTAAVIPSMYLYFKSEGWNGVNNGIGVAYFRFNGSGTPYVRAIYAAPAAAATGGAAYATPHVIRQNSKWRLLVQQYPDIVEFVSTNPTTFTAAPTVRMDLATYRTPIVSWVVNEFFNPAYVCNDDPVGSYDLRMFPGSRDTNAGAVVSGAWSTAVAHRTILDFALNTTPEVSWTSDDEWRHWDMLGLTTGDYLVYFDEKDVNGNNFIRLGGTDLGWSNASVRSRICP